MLINARKLDQRYRRHQRQVCRRYVTLQHPQATWEAV